MKPSVKAKTCETCVYWMPANDDFEGGCVHKDKIYVIHEPNCEEWSE